MKTLGLSTDQQYQSTRKVVTETIYHFDPKIQHMQHRMAQAILSEHIEHQRKLREAVREVARHNGLTPPAPRSQPGTDPLHDHILDVLLQHIRTQGSGSPVVYSLRPPDRMMDLDEPSARSMWTSVSHHSIPLGAVKVAPPDATFVEDDSGLVFTRDGCVGAHIYEGAVHFKVLS